MVGVCMVILQIVDVAMVILSHFEQGTINWSIYHRAR